MTAGLQADIFSFNQQIGHAVRNLAIALDVVADIDDMLNNANRPFSGPQLVAAGMSQDDVTLVQEAFAALAGLRQLAYGQVAQPGAQPTNFFFQAQQLLGAYPVGMSTDADTRAPDLTAPAPPAAGG